VLESPRIGVIIGISAAVRAWAQIDMKGGRMQTLFSTIAIIIAVGSVIFAGIQTRILARQTRMLQTTAELSYNLEVITRMNEVILQIAASRRSRIYIWGKADQRNSRSCHEGRIFLDVLDSAVSGLNKLSKLRDSGFENWAVYAEYVLKHSRNLRDEVSDHPDWWPSIVPIAERLSSG
jgi:hypothetical protein